MKATEDKEALKAQRKERKRQQARDEILAVAMDIVNESGVSSVRIESIAEKMGVTKPALYHYFKSKEEIIFVLILRELYEQASVVEKAVAQTNNGADAVEILMRTVFDRYRNNLDLFRLLFSNFPGPDMKSFMEAEHLKEIRPSNQMLYERAEVLVLEDQKVGKFSKLKNARRFVFNAHMAVVGILNLKSMTEYVGDPLKHEDKDLIDDVCETFTAQLRSSK